VDPSSPTLISFCTGYAGLELGIERALGRPCRVLAYSEIEAFAIENLAAKVQAGFLPPAPIWSDLRSFPGKAFHGMVDILCGGYPCFTEDTLVLTQSGYRPIKTIQAGDTVLSHTGKWRTVTAVMQKPDAQLRRVTFMGSLGTVTTSDHPFYISRKHRVWNQSRRRYDRVFPQPGWREAGSLSAGDFGVQVLPPVVDDDRTEAFYWLVGRYLGDGWIQWAKTQNCPRVNICCSRGEADALEQHISEAGFHAYRSEENTTTRFAIVKKDLCAFLGQFGKYAHGKTLPGFVFELPESKARALLDGYLSADGYRGHNPRGEGYFHRVGTVSKPLAYGIALLAQRAYGVVASLQEYHPSPTKQIEGRTVNQRTRYTVNIPDRQREAFVRGDYGYKPLRSNEPLSDTGTVYNIAVEEDESYIANGLVVHNCQPFSSAGKRAGKADPRHLWPFFRAQIHAIHPRVVFFENVEGHVSLGLSTVLSDLEEDGYQATWGLFSAAEVGAPHRRKRVFILGYAKGDDERGFPFPPVYREGVTAGGSGCDGVADPGGEGLPDPLRGDRAGSGGRETPAGSPAGRGAVRDPLLSEGRVWAILAPDPGWPSRPGEPQYGWEPPRTVADAAGLQFCGVAPAGADPAGHPGPGAVSGQPAVLGVPPREPHDRGGEPGAAGGREPPDAGEGEAEPPLGGDPDGPPDRLDHALLCRSWDSRIDELRLLGNGVVPATAERAFRVLSAELCGLDVSDPAVLREIIGQGAPAISSARGDPRFQPGVVDR
jgi:hypothetical protein